ncbi:hypothetical protein FB45DRAFT_1095422 [Roridomyces roridus]|uniref:Uncharacterized protein n=1 Tax=Roridomyces roridus TaxID=1738132 RepID=A0AAD7BFG8_9AGAR|nr:hypothetical protein FB45DRAFT_1095422 [Roridomyces roridus]
MSSPLNPGVPARKRGSLCKFCLCIGLTTSTHWEAKFPPTWRGCQHSRIYQNQTLDEVANRSNVVRPLIDDKQTFDIAVSVWYSENNGSSGVSNSPIYSDIVFRGLRLADKHRSKNLTYKLPVTIFNRLSLNKNDLRAGFVLIPTSPSLLDQVTNFSTWRSEGKTPWAPVRSWPFSLGAVDSGPQTVADRALDSFGLSMPLLEFHEIGSQCVNSSEPEPVSVEKEEQAQDDEEEEEDQPFKIDLGETLDGLPHLNMTLQFHGPEKTILKHHPFVVTRTQIRVVDETHIFNRKLYNQEHKKLRSTSSLCGQGPYGLPDLEWCARTYAKHGNWETRFELKKTNESQSEWAYAPYVGHAASAAGPKKFDTSLGSRPNPCNQRKLHRIEEYHFDGSWCSGLSRPVLAAHAFLEFIEINWQISYSGRSPRKYFVADQVPSQRVAHNETEYKKNQQHDSAELWSKFSFPRLSYPRSHSLQDGLVGHRFHQDAHPRRRLFIQLLAGYVLSPLATILQLNYWYTRTSTVGISISGTVLQAVPDIVPPIIGAIVAFKPHMRGLELFTSLWAITLVVGFFLLTPLLMLRTVARLSFNWNAWIPSVSRASPNHKERASQRLDSRTSWVFQAAMSITLTAIIHLFEFPFDYELITSLHPARVQADFLWNTTDPLIRIYRIIWFPLQLTGQITQILLNYRSKTFAGAYKLTVLIRCIQTVLESFKFLPFIVGRYDARPGLSILGLVQRVILGVVAWQAFVYPKVTPKMEQEDADEE